MRLATASGFALLAPWLVAACGSSSHDGKATAEDGGATMDVGTGDSGNPPGLDGGVTHGDAASGDSGPGGGTDASMDGSFAAAAHSALPQVVNLGGPTLKAAKVQLIVYTEDPTVTDVDNMVTELTQTTTWSEQTSEYGIGPFTKLPDIPIAGTPPMTLDDNSTTSDSPFEKTLVANTSGATPLWGPADPDTIYAFLLPVGTNMESDGSCCTDFLGYHYEVEVSPTVTIPYAVICDCGLIQGVPLTALEIVTTTVSHELVEAVTDPRPDSDPAYVETDDNDLIWSVATGGEIADMCQYNSDSNYTPPGSTYMIQRVWSNAAAMAGTNPCVPLPTTNPFFESMPVLPDTFDIEGTPTKGVKIAVGASQTIDVQLYSTGPTTGPWTVTAYDMNDFLGGTANTTVSLDKNTGSNGDVLHLTIHVTSADAQIGAEGFILVSDLGGQENMAMGAIGN
jgi:hypothetical protein